MSKTITIDGIPHVAVYVPADSITSDDQADVALITVSQAAKRIPIRDSEARAWLRANGLVRKFAGRDMVIWPEAVAAVLDEARQ